MPLFDAHCHLQDNRLMPYLDSAVSRAEQVGVAGFMCCGTREDDWPMLPGIAKRFPGVRLSFGLHPWFIGNRSNAWLDTLARTLAAHPAAIGEIGLDHALDKATFADQETVFLAQIHLAGKLGLPVSIHCRRAWGRLMELLDEKGWPDSGFMIHSYSGSPELVAPLVRRGAYLSFSGAITFNQNVRGREALASVPLEHLLIETDSPDLKPNQATETPVTADTRNPVNEPACLVSVLKTAATIRNMPELELAETTSLNARELWNQRGDFSRTA